jgi:hypothetical protein
VQGVERKGKGKEHEVFTCGRAKDECMRPPLGSGRDEKMERS